MILPDVFAERTPDRAAVVLSRSGKVVTWAALIDRARRFANYLHGLGLRPGDHIAYILDNNEYVHIVGWGSRRLGVYATPVNYQLKAEESAYILRDCGAKVVIAQPSTAELALSAGADVPHKLMVGDDIAPGFTSFEEALATSSNAPLEGYPEGYHMCYSSGTTGQPKGIKRAIGTRPYGTPIDFELNALKGLYGFDENTVYLVPSPLYFAGGIGWSMGALRLGSSVIVMEKGFDPEETLQLIDRYKVTHAYFVPTHFVRMLKLPEEIRKKYNVSSLEMVIHGAAPCPVDVKERMLDWFGPIIHEFYSSTESPGFVYITPDDWVKHKGSVGRAHWGKIRIVDEAGKLLPTGEAGIICFEGGTDFAYHNDPEKTKQAYEFNGWPTNGDIGYLDEEGYLYLTDRRSHMIISGGVNIYPQESENVLTMHPAVKDVAVIGVPNKEYGEEVKAVVIAEDAVQPGVELEQQLIEYCRARLAHYKCPKTVDFVAELPRNPTGKLMKRELRSKYWPDKRVKTGA
jgi:acyl-CoA synthetase (AMP-forming)/AMP-acid ligase II